MGKEKITCLLGCGQKGLEWADQQKGGLTLCLDQDIDFFRARHLESPDLIIGSALLLPLKKGSVNKIHADFLLNAVFPKGITFVDVKTNPIILQAPPFPPSVGKWYRETLQFSNEPIDNHLKTIRWLLRTTVLEQMWKVLAENGEIIIVDKREIIHWVKKNAVTILQIGPESLEINLAPITTDDHKRSNAKSLKVIQQHPNGAKKIVLKKHPARDWI